MRHALLGLAVVAAVMAAAGPAAAGPVGAGADRVVVRVAVPDRATLLAVTSWLEPWEVADDGLSLVADVDETELARLRGLGLEPVVDDTRTARLARFLAEAARGAERGIPGYPCYRTVGETLAAGVALAAAHPDLAEWLDIGDSWEKTQPGGAEGHDLMALRLTNRSIPGDKPKLWVQGGIHARELTTAELATRFAEQLLADYGVDPDATWVLDHHEVWVLLQTNPDGRLKAETGQSWRKNTDNLDGSCSPSLVGIDLNRNYDFYWGCCDGSSPDPCDETFRGRAAGSEPETLAVQSLIRSVFPDNRADDLTSPVVAGASGIFLDLHSYGGDVLSPWGFNPQAPPDGSAILAFARRLAYLNGYDARLGSLYTVDGSTKDFAYGERGLIAHTIELGTDFFEECSVFESVVLPDNLPALRYAARAARAPFEQPQGPEVVAPAATPSVVAPGGVVQLAALVDDTRFEPGSGEPTQAIVGADAYVDVPPWAPGAAAVPLAAVDGAFNATAEAVAADLDTTGWAEGRHLVWLVGEDASGRRGVPAAVFVWVLDPATAPHIAGRVTSAGDGSPVAATVSAGPFTTTADGAGHYDLMVTEGTHDLAVAAPGYGPATVAGVVAAAGATTTVDVALIPYVELLADDVESGNLGWTATGAWAITEEASASPTHSWTDSPGVQYPNSANTALTSPALDLAGVTGTVLEFSHIYDLESGWDYGLVEVSTNGTGWTEAARYNGAHTGAWERVELALPGLDGAPAARLRFRLTSDSSVQRDGWHVDDIVVRGASPVTGLLFADGFESGDTGGWSATSP